ncbi:MAG: CocE/NonD family hydrolase [Burkholderiales bacterium]|jgi:putative CocE/NonD family hydrolase|nr:CocE/NonD family hydrolase [Betaproteobacteria bacterium]
MRLHFMQRVFLLFVTTFGTLAFGQSSAAPETEFNIRESYTKYEYRIPMRDGKKLFTSVYVPKDQSKTYPFLIQRTPYSAAPYGVDEYPRRLGPAPELLKLGYIFVTQDVRGRYMSEGTFIEMTPHKVVKGPKDFDESTDMYDTAEWLLKNVPYNNGRIGLWGNSYPGFFVSASIIDSHPAIKAASPQAPVTDYYMGDDSYHNGAFMLASNFGFYTSFKQQDTPTLPPKSRVPFDFGTQDGYEFYLKAGTLADIIKLTSADKNSLFASQAVNDTYSDYWQSRDISRHLKNIKTAVLTVGGWYDLEDPVGPLKTYREIGKNNKGIFNSLVMGPWSHGGWLRYDGAKLGHVDFGFKTADWYRKNILVPFFEKHLKDKEGVKVAEANVFETGTNVWRQYSQWPPASTQSKMLYLKAGGKLGWTQDSSKAFDEYISDPAKPVPYTNAVTINVPQEYVVGDQRFAASRTDVLVYQSDVLEEDITIVGPVRPKLFVSTSGTDSDFVVKLIDVYPAELNMANVNSASQSTAAPRDVPVPGVQMAGYQQLIRGEPFRAKFRKSFVTPSPMVPNQVDKIEFDLPDILHTFRRGHRIMVQIQSSWFPLVDRNPQTFVSIPNAKANDYVKATQRVFRGGAESSALGVLVLVNPAGK